MAPRWRAIGSTSNVLGIFAYDGTTEPGSRAFEWVFFDAESAVKPTFAAAAVPEPSPSVLLLGGWAGLALLRRRWRQVASSDPS
jgi:hypothetical protein